MTADNRPAAAFHSRRCIAGYRLRLKWQRSNVPMPVVVPKFVFSD